MSNPKTRPVRMLCLLLAVAVFPRCFSTPVVATQGDPAMQADPCLAVGQYVFEDRELRLEVHLNADGSSLYQAVIAGEMSEDYRARGFWTMLDNRIRMRNRPSPVRLESAAPPVRDPAVALSISARLPDGSPAQGLAVSRAGALHMLGDGQHVVERGATTIERELPIVRAADNLTLQTITVDPDGPNSFSFIYHPSDEEPFDLEAHFDPRTPDMLEVELGTASVKTRRQGPRRSSASRGEQCRLPAVRP